MSETQEVRPSPYQNDALFQKLITGYSGILPRLDYGSTLARVSRNLARFPLYSTGGSQCRTFGERKTIPRVDRSLALVLFTTLWVL